MPIKIMKWFVVCVILFGVLFPLSFSKDIENGWVKFGFLGKEYTLNQRQFIIRANPLIGEGEKIKTIKKGQIITFEFHIGPTPSRAEQELKATGEELKQLARGEVPQGVGISQFDIIWVIKTSNNPVEILKNKISYDRSSLNLTTFAINIRVPEYSIHNPLKEKHNCWVAVDEMTDNRVKGRFGGNFQVDKLNAKDIDEIKKFLDKEFQIKGTFDVPFKKLYRYK